MRRRLLLAMILVASLAVVGFGVPLAASVRARGRGEAMLRLSEQASRAAVVVPASFAIENDEPELPASPPGIHLSLYDADGVRILGDGPVVADPVVLEALKGSPAESRASELVVAFPISESERTFGAIRAGMERSVVDRDAYQTWAIMAGWALVVLGAAGLVAVWRSHTLTRPLADLRDDADVLGGGGELPSRPPSGVAEIDTVRNALSESTSRLNRALARERSFSADLAHQLRTPLASLRLHIETEQLGSNRPALVEYLTDVDRLDQTIEDLLVLARDEGRTRESHALGFHLRQAAERWAAPVASAGRGLVVKLEPSLPWVGVSEEALRQILDVLIDNAISHGRGMISLSASRVGQGAVVEVADHGDVRLDPEEIFLRRSGNSSGTGIGLSLARRLAEAEDMRLVLSDPGPGAVFHLVIATRCRPS